jgi:hypothetical protein
MRKRLFSKNSLPTDDETSFFQKIAFLRMRKRLFSKNSLSTDEETSFPVFLNGTPKNEKLSGTNCY